MELLRSQQLEIANAIATSGVDMAQFSDWIKRPVGNGITYALEHKIREYKFHIEDTTPQQVYIVRMTPGETTPSQSKGNVGLGQLVDYARKWSTYVLREELAHAGFNALSGEGLGASTDQLSEVDTFSANEIELARASLRLLSASIVERFDIQDDQLRYVTDKIDLLSNEVASQPKRQFVWMLIGSLFNLTVNLGLESADLNTLLQLATQSFQWLVPGGTPLLN